MPSIKPSATEANPPTISCVCRAPLAPTCSAPKRPVPGSRDGTRRPGCRGSWGWGRWSGEGPHLPVEGPRLRPASPGISPTFSPAPSVPPYQSARGLSGMRRSPDVSPRRLSDISPQLRQLKYLVVDEAIKEDLKWSRSVEDLTSGPVGLTSIEERILRITGYYGYQPWATSYKSKTPHQVPSRCPPPTPPPPRPHFPGPLAHLPCSWLSSLRERAQTRVQPLPAVLSAHTDPGLQVLGRGLETVLSDL